MGELEYLFDTYKNAVFEKDLETFLSLFDENIRTFDAWDKWNVDGMAEWRKMVRGWFSSLGDNRDRVSFEEVRSYTSGDLVTVSAFARFAAVSPEGVELRFLHNRLTWFVRKKEGGWKIFHQHTSFPIDGNGMKVVLERL